MGGIVLVSTSGGSSSVCSGNSCISHDGERLNWRHRAHNGRCRSGYRLCREDQGSRGAELAIIPAHAARRSARRSRHGHHHRSGCKVLVVLALVAGALEDVLDRACKPIAPRALSGLGRKVGRLPVGWCRHMHLHETEGNCIGAFTLKIRLKDRLHHLGSFRVFHEGGMVIVVAVAVRGGRALPSSLPVDSFLSPPTPGTFAVFRRSASANMSSILSNTSCPEFRRARPW